jgi:hypothetical protein
MAAQGTHVTGKVILQLRTILALVLYVLLDPSHDDVSFRNEHVLHLL